MKLNKIVMALVLAFSTVSGAQAADQGHGKVTFTGSIIDAPCSITPQSIDQTVDLGQISKEALLSGGNLLLVISPLAWKTVLSAHLQLKIRFRLPLRVWSLQLRMVFWGLPELLKVPVLPLLRQMVKSSSWGTN